MTSNESLSLLERLRKKGSTVKSAAEMKDLVIEHQSEFPIKLRPKIAARAADSVYEFLDGIGIDVLSFIDAERNNGWTGKTPWEGPDRSVDSEEEIELMLRFFPSVLQVASGWSSLLAWSNAVHFLPLLWKLQKELFPMSQRLTVNHKWLSYFVYILLTNDFECDDIDGLRRDVEKYYGEDQQYDGESMLVLERMRKEGLLGDCNIVFQEVGFLFGLPVISEWRVIQSPLFIEKRLRLLVQWKASIIERLWTHLTDPECWNSFVHSEWLSLFRVILELGMTHFPMKLGFVFHTHHDLSTVPSPLHNLAMKSIQDVIPKHLSPSITLRSLVLAAATDDDISLTGVYTLVGMDPSQLISVCGSTTTAVANTKKRKLTTIQASSSKS